MSVGAVTLRLEMGCVPAEFEQRLPRIAPVTFDAARREFHHAESNRRWTLRLLDPRERRIANLRLPVVDVEITFEGYAAADIDAFMARFRAHFRRGGG